MTYPLLRRTLLPLFLRRIRVEGVEHVPLSGPYIVAGNHQSYTDPPEVAIPLIMLRDVKPWFLTTEHVWRAFTKFGGRRLLRWLGMIPIQLADKAGALQPALEELRRGGVVGIFPEGRRNKADVSPDWQRTLLKGKTGVARLALLSGTPVVPVGVYAPRGSSVGQATRNFFFSRDQMVVRYGPPLQFPRLTEDQLTRERLESVTRTVMQAIGTLCEKQYPY